MTKKEEAVKLIEDKMNKKTFLSYKEIADITGYHPKYILKLKKEVINGTISFVHGNKNRVPANYFVNVCHKVSRSVICIAHLICIRIFDI